MSKKNLAPSKKLGLDKTTLRKLDPKALEQVAGGAAATTVSRLSVTTTTCW
jgi:hypothetical protein